MGTNSSFGRIIEGDNQGFFKILKKEEDLSSEIMRSIPYSFMKSISNTELQSLKMVLNLPWGSSWPIKVSRNTRFYYMEQKGWEKFLSENALGDNEFLTFTHIGNFCFSINIFQTDSKEMLTPKSIASSSRNKREQKKNIYKDVTTAESTTRRRLGKMKVEEGDHTSYLVPEFTLTIKKSYLLSVAIPRAFAGMHMPKERKVFKIHDLKENKTWEVTYVIVNEMQSRLSPGWVRVSKDLGLVVGDVCTFKLIKPAEMVLDVSRKTTTPP